MERLIRQLSCLRNRAGKMLFGVPVLRVRYRLPLPLSVPGPGATSASGKRTRTSVLRTKEERAKCSYGISLGGGWGRTMSVKHGLVPFSELFGRRHYVVFGNGCRMAEAEQDMTSCGNRAMVLYDLLMYELN